MTGRSMRFRLDRLAEQIDTRPRGGLTCRRHRLACQMGRRWPVPYMFDPNIEWIKDTIRNYKISQGEDVGPHPRDAWAVDEHVAMTEAELQAERDERARLLAEAKAKNEAKLAELQGRRDTKEIPWTR